MFQPTFGFLLSYIPAAFVIGLITGGSASRRRIALACVAGLDVMAILWAGMLPFLPWDAVKIAATVVLAGALVPRMKEMK